MKATSALLEVENLHTWLSGSEGTVRAVDGVSFSVAKGETFALLGESGCGKSMTALSITRLLPDSGRVMSGAVRLNGDDLHAVFFAALGNRRHDSVNHEDDTRLVDIDKAFQLDGLSVLIVTADTALCPLGRVE